MPTQANPVKTERTEGFSVAAALETAAPKADVIALFPKEKQEEKATLTETIQKISDLTNTLNEPARFKKIMAFADACSSAKNREQYLVQTLQSLEYQVAKPQEQNQPEQSFLQNQPGTELTSTFLAQVEDCNDGAEGAFANYEGSAFGHVKFPMSAYAPYSHFRK